MNASHGAELPFVYDRSQVGLTARWLARENVPPSCLPRNFRLDERPKIISHFDDTISFGYHAVPIDKSREKLAIESEPFAMKRFGRAEGKVCGSFHCIVITHSSKFEVLGLN